ncbi:hypothetical protein MTBBW1_280017 [Desulfamplus magnetovallimortis]|uniref:Uncharacterized protein n=1 Tax=Desulfamplus magnetovallimortis TaxID=1246637 RepID=A0A1W1HF96_9BACT|nr:hypothetical protein MTBBW1_280017 [Desulfamplus magnetovallimortis]
MNTAWELGIKNRVNSIFNIYRGNGYKFPYLGVTASQSCPFTFKKSIQRCCQNGTKTI